MLNFSIIPVCACGIPLTALRKGWTGTFDLPGFDILQHLVRSFALIEPRVSAVSHQLTPLHTLLHQESLKGIVAQEAEFLQTQQTCPECESSDLQQQSQFAFFESIIRLSHCCIFIKKT